MNPALARQMLISLDSSSIVEKGIKQADSLYLAETIGVTSTEVSSGGVERETVRIAYAYLAAGCSLAEAGDRLAAAKPLETAGLLFEHVYGREIEGKVNKGFNQMIGALAYYAAGHYSRAYIAFRTARLQEPLPRMVRRFLRKDFPGLTEAINSVLLDERNRIDGLFKEPAEETSEHWYSNVTTILLARAFSCALEFKVTGNEDWLQEAIVLCEDSSFIAQSNHLPLIWWCSRLIRLCFLDLNEASPWSVLKDYFDLSADTLGSEYIQSLFFQSRPVSEIWHSQQTALPRALDLDSQGAVISLRTSAGKTRVAEIAILQSLIQGNGKILYLAPFRSLAYEVETSLSSTLAQLGAKVSYLYGGSSASTNDSDTIENADIIVATPEKARAIVRRQPDFLDSCRLIIVDEGHLLGFDVRLIRNEMFLEQIRAAARKSGARILLLSAVLPNVEQVASWIGGSSDANARSTWKPSTERCGLLKWEGTQATIEWQDQGGASTSVALRRRNISADGRKASFPKDKQEAVAEAAIHLANVGPVLIFTGLAASINGITEALLLGLGEDAVEHNWPRREWVAFESACRECYGAEDAFELRAARFGIICHSAKLPDEVRYAVESLMRARTPAFIVSTSTLAQGVNIGVSSVIIANAWIDKEPMSKQDFWNIAGRAGRAFVDTEGKVLYAIDYTIKKKRDPSKQRDENRRRLWQIRRNEELAKDYFDHRKMEDVKSGILELLDHVIQWAHEAQIPATDLVEILSENRFSRFASNEAQVSTYFDLIDDTLLAISHSLDPIESDLELGWVDGVFSDSLAAILMSERVGSSSAILEFLKCRTKGVRRLVPDRNERGLLIRSGLPLRAAKEVLSHIDRIAEAVSRYAESPRALEDLIQAVENLEVIIDTLPLPDLKNAVTPESKNVIRTSWLSGTPIREINNLGEDSLRQCRDYYGRTVPWVANGAAKMFETMGKADLAKSLDELSSHIEFGLPTNLSILIYLAGIRSRSAATEISKIMPSGALVESVSSAYSFLTNIENQIYLLDRVTDDTRTWLLNLKTVVTTRRRRVSRPFSLPRELPMVSNTIYVRKHKGDLFFCSPDYTEILPLLDEENVPETMINSYREHLERRDKGALFMTRRLS